MTFLPLILKNLWRHKTRTALTMQGVSIGIATIIALGAVSTGIGTAMSGVIQTGKVDSVIAQANAAVLDLSAIDEKRLDAIRAMPGLATVEGSFFIPVQAGSNLMLIAFGCAPEAAAMNDIRSYEGRMFSPDAGEVVIG